MQKIGTKMQKCCDLCFLWTKYVRDYAQGNAACRFYIIKFLWTQIDMPAESVGSELLREKCPTTEFVQSVN